ncbi:hypothetical protein P175DRAFT_0501510 [Aspergillus ochraceoroseus IBT 24754]|uniref:NAD-dependent epimerase/dehydratase domain-containing protein n=3 Tax=Aspergillus subgen. Nidulantes TaxID=2720870 RepID=A0A0F8TWX4_9EURO|nr:uncharacterized protein P175DRAFT_0501510 [Aspergillus ochraceoroseus IBT 24754]KKK11994.1 hypothetical protein ARAM_007314 [Aspergillus rambellii]KKK12425.1 hypothetical protein AOCH_003149 [Aspergillus ochraceoroseus]PTU20878.1 hypothetical protein P175DRAFT_0501510 [Aspergillus ochraceoroseus IBT 24754]
MSSSPSNTLVLVTGGSGFVGSYCIIALVNHGYQVRTTIRNVSKSPAVVESLKNGGLSDADLERVSFVAADLSKDKGWDKAVEGCTYVLHVASPLPTEEPKDENEVIIPARDGTLRVLKAARRAGVKRVVLTSAFNAIGYGHPQMKKPFTEEYWSDIENTKQSAYVKSKVIAERAAWAYVKSDEGAGLELTSVNPVAIFGPVLGKDLPGSIHLIQRLMNGEMPGSPQLYMSIVDVRDVAELEVLAMTSPAAKGERFLAVSPPGSMMNEYAVIIKKRLPQYSQKLSVKSLPNMLMRFMALFNKQIAGFVSELGKEKPSSNDKAVRLLGWKPRDREETMVATAETLVKYGFVKQ